MLLQVKHQLFSANLVKNLNISDFRLSRGCDVSKTSGKYVYYLKKFLRMWPNSSYVSKNNKKNVVLDYSRRFSAEKLHFSHKASLSLYKQLWWVFRTLTNF